MLQRIVHVRRLATLEYAAVSIVRLFPGRAPLLAPAGGAADAQALVHPGTDVVRAALGVVPGEETVEVLGVSEVLVNDRRRVGVVDDVFPEIPLVFEDVVDNSPQKGDVRAGPNW